MNAKRVGVKVAPIYFVLVLFIVLNLSLVVFSCDSSKKINLEVEGIPPVLNEEQQTLFDTYFQRLKEFPNIRSDSTSNTSLGWEYDQTVPELADFVVTHNLRDVMGDGTEIERFIYLMEWVHEKTYSEKELGNPDTLNSLAILNYITTQKRAVNCRMKSIVLNEILLSLGYCSRRLSCKPSLFDGDSHAIVTVYSNEMDKWICLDPTFNTFFHDGEGNVLSYVEIRNAYTNGEIPAFRAIPLTPTGSLMLSGIAFETYDQWYAVYMAKNCFKASCPQHSKFGYEDSEGLTYVYLLPKGYVAEDLGNDAIFTYNSRDFFKKPL